MKTKKQSSISGFTFLILGFILGIVVVNVPDLDPLAAYRATYGETPTFSVTSTSPFPTFSVTSIVADSSTFSVGSTTPLSSTFSVTSVASDSPTFSVSSVGSPTFSVTSVASDSALSTPFTIAGADSMKQSGDETVTPTVFEMISAYLFGPSIAPVPEAAKTLPASILPTQDLSNLILPSQPPVGVTRGENFPRAAQEPEQRAEEMGVQRTEETRVQNMDEPQERVGDIMHGVAGELDAVAEKENLPNKEDQQRVETVGLTMAGQVFKAAIWGPLMTLLAVLFGGGR